VITIVVILNCNQSLLKELHKGIKRYGNREETHNSNWKKKLESLSALVLILKKESFLYYIRQEAALNES
jgi:hypothetical protein